MQRFWGKYSFSYKQKPLKKNLQGLFNILLTNISYLIKRLLYSFKKAFVVLIGSWFEIVATV